MSVIMALFDLFKRRNVGDYDKSKRLLSRFDASLKKTCHTYTYSAPEIILYFVQYLLT